MSVLSFNVHECSSINKDLHAERIENFQITDSPPLSVISPSLEYFQQLVSEHLWFSVDKA